MSGLGNQTIKTLNIYHMALENSKIYIFYQNSIKSDKKNPHGLPIKFRS